tara:strand:+ start:657 stop:983 length:327 start_codon:yes stop_codon:yes gene_type:complete
MKITFDSLQKIFKKKKRVVKHDLFSPRHDWQQILIFFFIAVIGTILLHGIFYLQVERGSWLQKSAVNTSLDISVNRNTIETAAEKYVEKESQFEFVRQNPESVPDPSL